MFYVYSIALYFCSVKEKFAKNFAAPEKRSTRSRTRHFELTLRSVIDRSLLAYDISRHGKRNTQNEQRQAALKHQFGRNKPE